DELRCGGNARIQCPQGAGKDFVPGGISEEAGKGFVAIQHVAVTATAENPGRIPLKAQPVALLRCPVRSFPSLALSAWPQEVLICQVWSLGDVEHFLPKTRQFVDHDANPDTT